MYPKFSRNFHSDLSVYDACLQKHPVICHFLFHFPITHQQISSFRRKEVESNTQKICMHVTKLLILNLIESYFEDFLHDRPNFTSCNSEPWKSEGKESRHQVYVVL